MGNLWAVLQLSQQSIGNTGENKKIDLPVTSSFTKNS